MFKKGDKIRCVKDCDKQFTAGKIYTVRDMQSNVVYVVEDDLGSPTNGHYLAYFEPVETELERLVRVANEGREAENILYSKYEQEVVLSADNGPMLAHILIRQKTKKFKVASWDAEINGDTVTIGCQKFDLRYLKHILTYFLKGGFGGDMYTPFNANRTGIIYSKNHSITWDQAEALLKEFEAA